MQILTPLAGIKYPGLLRLLLAVLSLGLFLSAGQAAVVINVDINGTDNFSGQGAYADVGNNLWNGFALNSGFYNLYNGSPVSSGALVDSTNASTGGVQLSFSGGYMRGYTYSPPSLGGAYSTGNALLDDDVYYTPGESYSPGPGPDSRGLQFTFSNLTPNTAYTLYLYGDSGKDQKATDFSVDGVVQTTTGRNTNFTGTYVLGGDYVVYNTTSDSSGNLSGYYTAHAGNPWGAFSGAQLINPVPEPQTWALAALGVSAVIFRLRRKVRLE